MREVIIRISYIADVWEDRVGGRLLQINLLLLMLYRDDRLLIDYICVGWLQIFAEDHVISWSFDRRRIEVSVLVKTTLRCRSCHSKVILLY